MSELTEVGFVPVVSTTGVGAGGGGGVAFCKNSKATSDKSTTSTVCSVSAL